MINESKVPYLLGGGITEESPLGAFYMREATTWTEDFEEPLFHYTTSRGLEGILQSQSLWATHAAFLNDLSEMGYARTIIVEALDEVYEETAYELLGEQKEKGYADLFVLRNDTVVPFITSFCENGDQLSQWRGYAGSGQGYSIGFDLRNFGMKVPGPCYLRRVVYESADQMARLKTMITDWVEVCQRLFELPTYHVNYPRSFQPVWALKNVLLDYHFCLKHPTFREEKEWRLVKFVDVSNLKMIAQDDRDRIDELLIAARLDGKEPSAMYALAHSSMNVESLEVVKFRSADSGLTPYIEQTLLGLSNGVAYRLPIKSIIVGPSVFADGQVEAAKLLTSLKFDLPEVTVERSDIPLR